jgi:hypothetical protein
MSKPMPVLLALVVGVLGGALIGGSALLGASAQPAPASAASTHAAAASTGTVCGWRLKHLPAKLRADLKAARALPRGERRPALRKIARAARAGDYGTRVQKIAKKRHHLRQLVRKRLPADLKADLKKTRHLPVGERKAARKQIRAHVLAGDYGTFAQKVAERRKAHRAACRASRKPSTA